MTETGLRDFLIGILMVIGIFLMAVPPILRARRRGRRDTKADRRGRRRR